MANCVLTISLALALYHFQVEPAQPLFSKLPSHLTLALCRWSRWSCTAKVHLPKHLSHWIIKLSYTLNCYGLLQWTSLGGEFLREYLFLKLAQMEGTGAHRASDLDLVLLTLGLLRISSVSLFALPIFSFSRQHTNNKVAFSIYAMQLFASMSI